METTPLMTAIALFVFAVALEYGVALLFWCVQRRSRAVRAVALILVSLVGCFAGLAIPAENKALRLAAVLLDLFVALRVYSYSQAGRTSSLGDFLRFLSIGLISPHLVHSRARQTTKASPASELPRVAIALLIIPIVWVLARLLVLTEAGKHSWILNHLIVVVAFMIVLQSVGQCCWRLWRMLGLRSKPLVDNVVLSLTPAEFWRRWSWPMHLWLYRHVFIPAGGRAHFYRAVFAVFLANALLHEVVAFVGLGRVTGHWTLCFLLGALGVVVSPSIENLARRGMAAQIAARVITIVFLIVMAVPAFVGINYFLPLYYKKLWLMW
jgi:hypothetical protein